ncbi:bone morphogenetic protein 1-like [Haliotis rubra]|uniref:bone morphogenetic protein 1-like n=1 Tax=Haliotis rubra TaxID=36100 RepID=UPI001EE4ED85|nr:bone morphogenetic protein 1-like [Haliotis rubra]
MIMKMVFKTNGDTSGRGFRLRASHSIRKVEPPQSGNCGSLFLNATTNRQFLQSPGYPVRYQNKEDCRWTITASSPNMMLRIEVIDSDIYSNDRSYVTCRYDHVTAYDGPSIFNDTLSSWCGPSRPTFQSTGSAVTIHFHTDTSTAKRGFKLAYFETNVGCQTDYTWARTSAPTLITSEIQARPPKVTSSVQTTPPQTIIQSKASSEKDKSLSQNQPSKSSDTSAKATVKNPSKPNYENKKSQSNRPRKGSNNQVQIYNKFGSLEDMDVSDQSHVCYDFHFSHEECIWTIHAPANTNIEAKVRNTLIESTSQCTYDFLEIYDGVSSSSSSAGRLCGDDDTDYISSGHVITVRFHSDSFTRRKGFQMHLKAGHFSVSETEEFSASYSSKYIYSPNYPFNYPSNAEVGWKITADEDYIVKVNVIESRLEKSFGCANDYVEAFDGPNSNAPSLGCWCGKSEPIKRSSGSVMFLKFKSDSSGVDRGFKIEYTNEYNYHSDLDTDVGAIVGGSIGGAFLLLLIISVIGICIYKHGQRTTATNLPVQYTVGQVPVINHFGQAQITNAMPATTFTGPPTYTPAAQGAAVPYSGYVNAEALPNKY